MISARYRAHVRAAAIHLECRIYRVMITEPMTGARVVDVALGMVGTTGATSSSHADVTSPIGPGCAGRALPSVCGTRGRIWVLGPLMMMRLLMRRMSGMEMEPKLSAGMVVIVMVPSAKEKRRKSGDRPPEEDIGSTAGSDHGF